MQKVNPILQAMLDEQDETVANMLPALVDMEMSELMQRFVAMFLTAREAASEGLEGNDSEHITWAAMMLSSLVTPRDIPRLMEGVGDEALRKADQAVDRISGKLSDEERKLMRLMILTTKLALEVNERLVRLKSARVAEA